MLIIELLILVTFILIYSKTRKYELKFLSNTNNQKKSLFFLYPMSLFLLDHLKLSFLFDRTGKIKSNLKALHVHKNTDIANKLYWCEKVSTFILILFVFNLLSLFATMKLFDKQVLHDGKYINRPSYGEGSENVNLKVNAKNKKGEQIETNIDVSVNERRYKKENIEQIIKDTMNYIDVSILGENTSLDYITKPLNLIKKVPNTSITIDWELDKDGLINSQGKIEEDKIEKNKMKKDKIEEDKIEKEGILTSITAHIKYFDTKATYQIFLKLIPKEKTEEEIFLEHLKESISIKSEQTITEEKLELPTNIGDSKLKYYLKKDSLDKKIFMLGFICAIVIFFGMDQDIQKKSKMRELQLMVDYPEIINKFVLLLGAGMTIKGAWGKIIDDYRKKIEKEPHSQRFAYEEMLVTWHELGVGVSESKAYENFGKRVKLISYLRFSSLITQNLNKGSKGLLDLLEFESIEAFEERKELAKRLGEEAGTKLLAPMMIMLVIAIFIVIVPAFMTLGV